MTIQTHQPWKPTCWVGGLQLVCSKYVGEYTNEDKWLYSTAMELSGMSDDERRKYAATKATAAILRAMRKNNQDGPILGA